MTLGIRPTVKPFKLDHVIFNSSSPTLKPTVKHSVIQCSVVTDLVFNGNVTVSKLVTNSGDKQSKIFKDEFHVQYYNRHNDDSLLGLKT